jgi:hypothetical protein
MSFTQTTLIPVPMYIYWQEVLKKVNEALKSDYKYQGYMYEVYRGTKRNAQIETVIDGCIATVNEEFAKRGVQSKYPIVPHTKQEGL